MKEKNILALCMRYSESCKLCPRNKKCEKELSRERLKTIRGDHLENKYIKRKIHSNNRGEKT